MRYQILFALVIIAALLIVGRMEMQDDQASEEEYCRMVGIYKKSSGAYGWPDYKGNAKEVCSEQR